MRPSWWLFYGLSTHNETLLCKGNLSLVSYKKKLKGVRDQIFLVAAIITPPGKACPIHSF